MKLHKIIFSPTGGTKKVTDILAEGWDCEKTEVDLTDVKGSYRQAEIGAEDVCIVSVPSYGGRVPELALERLAQVKGNGARAVAVVSFGNRAIDDTLLELKEAMLADGFQSVAAIEAVTEHSIVRKFGAGRPDEADKKELLQMAAEIRGVLEAGTYISEVSVPGKVPYKERGASHPIPLPEEGCVKCGVCADKCPDSAIDGGDPAQVDAEKCIGCMRCIAVCPIGVRHLSSAVLAGVEAKIGPVCGGRKENKLYMA